MLNWSKRRPTDAPKDIVDIELVDFEKTHNHFCTMKIKYKDSDEYIELKSRVLHNRIKDTWVVNGINSKGDYCTIDMISF